MLRSAILTCLSRSRTTSQTIAQSRRRLRSSATRVNDLAWRCAHQGHELPRLHCLRDDRGACQPRHARRPEVTTGEGAHILASCQISGSPSSRDLWQVRTIIMALVATPMCLLMAHGECLVAQRGILMDPRTPSALGDPALRVAPATLAPVAWTQLAGTSVSQGTHHRAGALAILAELAPRAAAAPAYIRAVA